jgi:RimJ/RimL family protein N-acetyltransferase
VVIGASHPARQALQAACAARPATTCHVQTSDMAALLVEADLAVGAGGSATWERCALGVPTLGLCLADNQRELLRHAARHGLVYAPQLACNDAAAIALHLRALLVNPGLRQHLSRNGLDRVDGNGAQRVVAAMSSAGVQLRRATPDDAAPLHAWRNHPSVRAMSNDSAEIDHATHRRWLDAVLESPSRPLFIGERDGVPVGVLRFDIQDATAEVSIYLVAGHSGRGEGGALLRAGEDWMAREQPQVHELSAQVNSGNRASHRLFERCGYAPRATRYTKRIGP